MLVVIKGSESIKLLETLAAPMLLLVGVGLFVWVFPQVEITELMSIPAKRPEGASFWGYFLSGLTAMVGFWATLSLNIPDFSRYAVSQKDQIWGQILGLPLTMLLFSSLGVILTAASEGIFGQTYADPVSLIGAIDSPLLGSFALFIIILATLSTNTAANIVSPTNDFQNVFPKLINSIRGTLLTGLIGIIIMSWELLRKLGWVVSDVSIESLYSNFLLAYSSLLGPIAGIMITDYFLVKKQKINLVDIYLLDGEYPRVNYAGIISFILPIVIMLICKNIEALSWIASYGWFTGSAMGALCYYVFHFRKLN